MDGNVTASDNTKKAYFEGSRSVVWSAVTDCSTNDACVAAPSAAPKYSADRVSFAAWTNSTRSGSDRRITNTLLSSAGKASPPPSIRNSQRLNAYPTSSGANCTVARPLAGTSTLRVATVLPFTTNDTVFSTAGVPKPATTA